jgi:hypothetical protein
VLILALLIFILLAAISVLPEDMGKELHGSVSVSFDRSGLGIAPHRPGSGLCTSRLLLAKQVHRLRPQRCFRPPQLSLAASQSHSGGIQEIYLDWDVCMGTQKPNLGTVQGF